MVYAYDPEKGLGYENRGRDKPDYKETFHLSLSYMEAADESTVAGSMIGISKDLIHSIIPLAEIIGLVMSEASGVPDLDILMTRHPELWTLRLLYYPPDSREIRAESHVDKGITIHLTATAPGLQIWWGNQWIDVPESHNSAYGYAGLLGQYYTKCSLKGLLHQVVSCNEAKKEGRYSIVLFFDFGDVRYDKAVHGRTQERFSGGENYDMTFDEFRKFFAPIEQAKMT